MYRSALFSLFIGLAFVSPGVAQEKGAPVKVTTVEGVTEYRLANGARLLLYPEQSRPVVTVNMTVLVGSRHEGYGESGMAHLLEHMVFKGTPTFSNVPKSLRDHGANGFLSEHGQQSGKILTEPFGVFVLLGYDAVPPCGFSWKEAHHSEACQANSGEHHVSAPALDGR